MASGIEKVHCNDEEVERLEAERACLRARVEGLKRIAEHRSEKIERLSAAVDAVRVLAESTSPRRERIIADIRAALDEHLGEG